MKRRQLILAGGATAALPWGLHAQPLDLNEAINKAGRQRMLSQRMAKSYCAAGQGVLPEMAAETLAASMALFERQLTELKAFAPTAEIKRSYAELEGAWGDYRIVLASSKPTRERAPEMFGLSMHPLETLLCGSREENLAGARDIANGVRGPKYDLVLANAAAALLLAERVPSLSAGVELADRLLQEGGVREKIAEISRFRSGARET